MEKTVRYCDLCREIIYAPTYYRVEINSGTFEEYYSGDACWCVFQKTVSNILLLISDAKMEGDDKEGMVTMSIRKKSNE